MLYKYPKSPFREKSLINTVLSYTTLGQYVLAEEEIKLYLKKYNTLERADIIYYNRAYIAEKLGSIKKAFKYYDHAIHFAKTPSMKYVAVIKKIKLFITISKRYEAKELFKKLKTELSLICNKNKNQITYLERLIKWQYLLKYKIKNSSISHIAVNNNLVYILTWTNGIIVFDREKNKVVCSLQKEKRAYLQPCSPHCLF